MKTELETKMNHRNPSMAVKKNDNRPSASQAALKCFREYARERPETVTLWALGIGFVLGWKLKPW